MYDYDILEGGYATEDDYYKAMQAAINSGVAWRMQGSVGRAMMAAITEGYCMLAREPSYDAYGNYIPSRTDVVEGTKGSFLYVADRFGEDYAKAMAEVE